MAKSKAAKIELGRQLTERFIKAKGTVVAEYSGMKAEDLAALRRELRNVGSEFKVLNNRVAKKAIAQTAPEISAINASLKGPVGVVYLNRDLAEGAKVLNRFAKEKAELLKITGGFVEGRVISIEEFRAIAEMPSKEVLLAKIVGSLIVPHTKLLRVINGVTGNLVRVIAAIKDKKSG